MNTYKYVYRNPVRAGLVELCEDWPYSTLHGLLGKSHLAIPLLEDSLLFDGSKNLEILNWLNRGKLEDEIEIGRALRKSEFEFVRSHQNKKPVRDEHFIY